MIVKKNFMTWNLDKEIEWLNEMSEKGYHLIHANFGKYKFEEDKSKKYVYDIQSLKFIDFNGKDDEYVDFLKEANIEKVSRVFNWYYFRKEKIGDSEVVLFSDLTSKINHLSSIMKKLIILFIFICAVVVISFIPLRRHESIIFSAAWLIDVLVTFLLGYCIYRVNKLRKKLKEEQKIKE